MDSSESYLEGLMNCGLKGGDKVVILPFDGNKRGWNNIWTEMMGECIGQEHTISTMENPNGVYLYDIHQGFPYFCLRKVGEDPNKINILEAPLEDVCKEIDRILMEG